MLKYLINPMQKPRGGDIRLQSYDERRAKSIKEFHSRLPGYSKTPLRSLPKLAGFLGLDSIFVKDESTRFDLQSFKALGGSYAAAKLMAQRLNINLAELFRPENSANGLLPKGQEITFITATDGNHGRGVAWAARQFGQKAVVLMPKGSSEERVRHILNLGADCLVTDKNYDDTVRQAGQMAATNNWALIQDTAWPGYEQTPEWIMQGYLTLALEAHEELQQAGKQPTHILLQAGVGSLAASVAAFWVNAMPNRPRIIIVEPQAADCFYASALVNDELPHAVGGDLATIMAGLACGEPSSLAWPILRDYAFAFLSLADPLAALGMRVLAAPLQGDPSILSGESGAVPIGALVFACRYSQSKAAPAKALGLGKDSVVLSISTEGDTCPAMYQEIVWQGAKPLQL